MSRVKRGTVTRKRHKKLFKQTKGFWGQRKNIFRRATETLLRALAFSFKGRKLKKRNYRALFVSRINAACKPHGISYSSFMHGLKTMDVRINRKMLSQLAIYEPKSFEVLASEAKNIIS